MRQIGRLCGIDEDAGGERGPAKRLAAAQERILRTRPTVQIVEGKARNAAAGAQAQIICADGRPHNEVRVVLRARPIMAKIYPFGP
uniref:Probable glycine dehydrogenase subunit 1 n=1 Tax=Aureimonas frigidaquae TaxID=424757 RepID=A0A0P0Z0P2_9HYPH|nr:probable glycine dehydrogenase subunit 1 [Aureimonas frigidaquae]